MAKGLYKLIGIKNFSNSRELFVKFDFLRVRMSPDSRGYLPHDVHGLLDQLYLPAADVDSGGPDDLRGSQSR